MRVVTNHHNDLRCYLPPLTRLKFGIAAGLLVLIGSLLGFFWHPYFIGISAFVGAGLAFAGITDTCGMGMMLARMPWNQVSEDSQGSCCTQS